MVHAHAPESDDARRPRRLHRGRARRPGQRRSAGDARRAGRVVRPQHRPGLPQNYLENKAKFLGIGNYTEEGFASMEKALGLKDAMFAAALKTPNLKMVMGTDAVAGAHGQNMREICRTGEVGPGADATAIKSLTSLAAEVDESRRRDRRRGAGSAGRSRRRRRQPAHRRHRAAARALRHARRQGLQERAAGRPTGSPQSERRGAIAHDGRSPWWRGAWSRRACWPGCHRSPSPDPERRDPRQPSPTPAAAWSAARR